MKSQHINAKKGDFAKLVLMPGDPLRAKYIAETFLDNVKQVNNVRNMLMYTGTYNDKPISVCGSGIGQPSISIYAYELFYFYKVEKIVRIGSAGSYKKDLKLFDVILVESAFSNSNVFHQFINNKNEHTLFPSSKLNAQIEQNAKKLGIKITKGHIHSTDVFYNCQKLNNIIKEAHKPICVEMESMALFAIANKFHKEAATILTVSDNIITHNVTTWEQREKGFNDMIKIALELA